MLINTSACWDSRDIEELAFSLLASYDLHQPQLHDRHISCANKEELLVDVTTLVPNLAPESKNKIKIETQSGSTITYVRNQKLFSNSDEYMPGLNEVLILGEDLAKDGLNKHLDTTRVAVLSQAMKVAVAEGRGEDVVRTPQNDSSNMASYLNGLLKSQRKLFIPIATLHQLNTNITPGKNPVLPLLKKEGTDQVVIAGTAVFKKDRLIGKLDIHDSRSLCLLRGLKGKGYLPFCLEEEGQPPGRGTVLAANGRSVDVSRNGDNYVFTIKIKLQGRLDEHSCSRLLDQQHLSAIEQAIEKDISQECRDFVRQMQEELKVDCIDISKFALAKWRKELTSVIDDEEFIQNAQINVQVQMHIKNTGKMK